VEFRKKRGVFEDFLEHRSYLIGQYTNGDLTKKEFLTKKL